MEQEKIDLERQELLNDYYRYLYGRREVRTRKEFAEKVGVSYHTIGQAFSGGRYLTDALLRRIREAFPSLADMGKDGGQAVESPYTREFVESLQRTNESLARTNEALVAQLEQAQRAGYVSAYAAAPKNAARVDGK